jgi:16S rRNA (cytosine967-C5)-methyltransferase
MTQRRKRLSAPPEPPLRFQGSTHDARSLALEVLLECQAHRGFVQEVLDHQLARASLGSADRRLATQLVYGVLRRRGLLHFLARQQITRPASRVESWLWEVLALGIFQLAFLDQVPPHAAIHETVELASRFGRSRAKGFINGILRSLLPLFSDQRTTAPARHALPLEEGSYCVLTRALLPDPGTQPIDYLSVAFALPAWLLRRWHQRLGLEECYRLGFWFLRPAPVTLRGNALRTTREDLLAALHEAGYQAEAGSAPQAIRLSGFAPIAELPGYREGWFCVQDETAQHVGQALMPKPGDRLLDLCAAPGGKTTHLAELMNDQGHLLACDLHASRLQTVQTLAQRLGLTCIKTQVLEAEREEAGLPPEPFDAVLVDVPCSNTGVLGRRPEVRWRLQPGDIQELVRLQARLLRLAANRVKPGGVVVYSTCSIQEEENQALVRALLPTLPGMALEAEEETLAGRPADGGYWARLRRSGVSSPLPSVEEGLG